MLQSVLSLSLDTLKEGFVCIQLQIICLVIIRNIYSAFEVLILTVCIGYLI